MTAISRWKEKVSSSWNMGFLVLFGGYFGGYSGVMRGLFWSYAGVILGLWRIRRCPYRAGRRGAG